MRIAIALLISIQAFGQLPKPGQGGGGGGGGGGGVTSITASTGITGGTITSTGTIALDTVYLNTNYVSRTQGGSITHGSPVEVGSSASSPGIIIDGAVNPTGSWTGSLNIDLSGGFNWSPSNGLWQTISSPLTASRTFSLPDANSNSVIPSTCGGGQFISAISAASAITCGTPGGGSALTSGITYPLFGFSAYGSGVFVAQSARNALGSFGFVTSVSMATNAINFYVDAAATANCGGGSSHCGYTSSVYPSPLSAATSPLCVSAVAIGGSATKTDIESVGSKSLPWASGSDVSGGICTLPPGAYLYVHTSDSATFQIDGTNIGSSQGMMSVNHPERAGTTTTTAVATGTGATLAIPSDIHSVTFIALSGSSAGGIPYIVIESN